MPSMERILPCPHCRKQTPWHNNPYRPFCSERCRLIDLGNWGDEHYSISEKADFTEIPLSSSERTD